MPAHGSLRRRFSRAGTSRRVKLSARFNLQLDWGGDLDDEDFAADLDGVQLMSTAFDRLRENNYTLWSVDAGSDGFTGWMALTRDDDAMRFAHRTIFTVRTVAARYASPASPRAVIASLTASVSYVAR